MAKVTIEIPDGVYCTGCPCLLMMPVLGHTPDRKMKMWTYGCKILNEECTAEGEFQNRCLKRPTCPASNQ